MDLKQISVIMIVKNAQKTLKACLESLQEFGEIVLIENDSNDDTLKIAYEFSKSYKNIKIYQHKFIGFGPLKNLAISYASNDWIFNIDADELAKKEFLQELGQIEPNKEDIIALPRENLYNGEWIKACGWWPDHVMRVFNKTHTNFNENLVHESLILYEDSKKIKLQNGLRHFAFDDIDSLLDKLQKYSKLWALQNLHRESSVCKALLRGIWTFFRNYVLKKGIFYGYKGFIISTCNGLGAFFKYMKLYELKKQKPKTCALIITTYNQKERLALVLDSVKNLEPLPDEVLIADDGSREDTVKLIQAYQKDFPCKLEHIWQEDKGFRLSEIRNKAIKASKSEYIIVIDGDMVLEKSFVADHLKFAQKKVFLQGSRVILNEKESKELLSKNDFSLAFNKKGFKNQRNIFLAKCIYKFSKLAKKFFKKSQLIKGIRGCNMSFYKSDFEAIEGFNEKFIGWGREDSEFVARFLFNEGVFKRLKFNALAYHIYHEENSKNMLEINHQIYLETIKNKKITWR
ncbi:glycosyltransferase [Campylobacter sp. IFREMER_LSEM_CL1846]|uniref:glycosyltransferase family 2 protein n=1 Tax=unclassified Campylobacter TaxID=2593542 RepID=UPI0021E66D0E|nr:MULTISPECIES: glycosyltransferase [unclassified Campylobacter]HEC1747465.1 glycosyltransferase [Campylobacter lari]MCV3434645.1 glycosyltransferase [Campylobacter sp. IFREMER_LSEM_CL1846]MCV3443820.1 glycosyltransferase [Campylobacter sp. IFREMER_LSEM_CL1097]HEC1767937.1 glycosyltransferase [Campylobacter lari]HEC1788476.1 glycosyltransferase [Campylobacter lari]